MSNSSHLIFIHGLANKPPAADLRRIWLDALAEGFVDNAGFDLGAMGVRDTFVYWANLFYDEPLEAGDYESLGDELGDSAPDDPQLDADDWTEAMAKHFGLENDELFEDAPVSDADSGFERVPLPWSVKKRIIKHFLKEAHDYLFNVDGIRDSIRSQVIDEIKKAGNSERVVLIGHSQGSMIAYDVLTGVEDCPQVDGLMTFGSPLGIDEVQDKLIWSLDAGFPEKVIGDWVNVYDPFDVVAGADPRLANDFKHNGEERVIDVNESNWGVWRHSATKYLKGEMLRGHLKNLAGRA